MRYDVNDKSIRELFKKGEFGMELESLRITADGALSGTPHPFGDNKNITRDFCENQTEMITDVFDSIDGVLQHLAQLRRTVSETLEKSGELLWPFSNPPAFYDPDEIPIAEFKGSLYRDYLAEKYGKVKMLLSGIHLNYSLPQRTLERLAEIEGEEPFVFKNELYLSLAAKLLSYSWLIVYLTAASPVVDDSFARFGGVAEDKKDKFASVRCGEFGYWNFFTPSFDYSSLDSYINSIQKYADDGDIISCSELYYPIRVKPRGKYGLDTLRENGINHIELRMADINPLSPVGIFELDLRFIHLLILYLLFSDEPLPNEQTQLDDVLKIKQAALSEPGNAIKSAALSELKSLLSFAENYYPEYSKAVKYQIKKAESGGYAKIIREMFSDCYMRKGLFLAKQYQKRGDFNVHDFCGELGREL